MASSLRCLLGIHDYETVEKSSEYYKSLLAGSSIGLAIIDTRRFGKVDNYTFPFGAVPTETKICLRCGKIVDETSEARRFCMMMDAQNAAKNSISQQRVAEAKRLYEQKMGRKA